MQKGRGKEKFQINLNKFKFYNLFTYNKDSKGFTESCKFFSMQKHRISNNIKRLFVIFKTIFLSIR